MPKGKKIILGITGGIAAYKSAVLARELKKKGAEVQIILSPGALDFVTPLTLATLTGKPVLQGFFDKDSGQWENHVHLGLWADLMLIAPLTANTLAKMATGLCDNLLMAVYLSARCPVMVAPAMDLDMWAHPSTQKNIKKLGKQGVHVLGPEKGALASGLEGEGRMMEPEHIVRELTAYFKGLVHPFWAGKKVLITAGPTHEAIDPVRFIGNRSSGKMGYSLAAEAVKRGAQVTLVSGPVQLEAPEGVHKLVRVESAAEMYRACMEVTDKDISIMNAAVADFTPAKKAKEKIKKATGGLEQVDLVQTQDILAALAQNKKAGEAVYGFALETQKGMEHAREKLKRKKLTGIFLNSLEDAGAGFAGDQNRVYFLDQGKEVRDSGLRPKTAIAAWVLDRIQEQQGAGQNKSGGHRAGPKEKKPKK